MSMKDKKEKGTPGQSDPGKPQCGKGSYQHAAGGVKKPKRSIFVGVLKVQGKKTENGGWEAPVAKSNVKLWGKKKPPTKRYRMQGTTHGER